MSTNYFNRIGGTPYSTTGTGLDQLVDTMATELGLRGRISSRDLSDGMMAADGINALIIEAIEQTGVGADGQFGVDDVLAINAYIRANHLETFTALHGDDEKGEETGFHLVQNDGARERYRGENLVNTVADGLYHIGFEVQDGHFVNEDGNRNASVEQLAEWLSQFYTDHSTTQTGLDRITDMIMADRGLDRRIDDEEIEAGADAANGINALIEEAIQATNAAADGAITVDDVRAINAYIRANHLERFIELHGDDENGEETGFHLVQNDGANTRMFGENFVNTVADGLYHIGFEIQGDNVVNEDGNANASLSDLAAWLNYFYVDQGTTGTGLDELVQIIKSDRGLSRNTDADDINEGAEAADGINQLIHQAIQATGIAADKLIDIDDVKAINAYIRANHYDQFVALHGDDEGDEETGFHLVQNDGARVKYRGDNFVNTVMDGLYHLGFQIQGDNILNEDGDANASLGDLATWLNNFYLGEENTFGSEGNDRIRGLNVDERIWARDGNDRVDAKEGNDFVDGGNGNDRLNGGDGNDELLGGDGNDHINGQNGDDILLGGNGNDRLNGGDGNDTISAGTGNDRANGGDGNDFVDGGDGNDHVNGQNGDDRLLGGDGNDRLNGGDGNDTISAGTGSDRANGGDGDDFVDGGGGNDHVNGQDGNDRLFGGEGNDRVNGGDGADVIFAGAGDDRANGGADDDFVDGGSGNDRVNGQNGNDRLVDGAGSDIVQGGCGNDILLAVNDGANDRFIGNAGADQFLFYAASDIGADQVRGFRADEGDQLIIGGPDVSFELEQIRGNRSQVTLTDSNGEDLGSILVFGAINADDVSINNAAFAGFRDAGVELV